MTYPVGGNKGAPHMRDTPSLDRTYCVIRDTILETGWAPHFTDLARTLDIPVEEARRAVTDLMESHFPGWFHPGMEHIAAFSPFANFPTHNRITVDGEQKWYTICGFESLSVCWLFPGKTLRVDTNCVHSGEPLRVDMCDGEVLVAEPGTICAYVNVPYAKWFEDKAYV